MLKQRIKQINALRMSNYRAMSTLHQLFQLIEEIDKLLKIQQSNDQLKKKQVIILRHFNNRKKLEEGRKNSVLNKAKERLQELSQSLSQFWGSVMSFPSPIRNKIEKQFPKQLQKLQTHQQDYIRSNSDGDDTEKQKEMGCKKSD